MTTPRLAEYTQRIADMQAEFLADSSLMDNLFRNRTSLDELRQLWRQQSALQPIPRSVGPENAQSQPDRPDPP